MAYYEHLLKVVEKTTTFSRRSHKLTPNTETEEKKQHEKTRIFCVYGVHRSIYFQESLPHVARTECNF